MIAPAGSVQLLQEIACWKQMGVAVLPGPLGEKGPREPGWPSLPHTECWTRAQAAATRGATNLCIRTGPTADGRRYIAAIDLDGKCPCGHDLDDHEHAASACGGLSKGNGQCASCVCAAYSGCPPDTALALLQDILPRTVWISRTARGYHLIFFAHQPLPNGVISRFSADLKGGLTPSALQVPPSLHPSGKRYAWFQRPTNNMPIVDLVALGLEPDKPPSKGCGAAGPQRTAGARHRPVSAKQRQEFARLMSTVGIERQRDDELVLCPWHADAKPSLHITWPSAVFYCFSCGEGGSISRLRALLPHSCDPNEVLLFFKHLGPQVGGAGVIKERNRLADALTELGNQQRAGLVAGCREVAWDDPSGLIAYTCPTGDAAPVLRRLNSCDDFMCPSCMPWRLRADWQARHGDVLPPGITIAVLTAREASDGLVDPGYGGRVRKQLTEWRRARGLRAGFTSMLFVLEDGCWRASIIVALPDAEADKIAEGRGFAADIRATGVSGENVGRVLQQAYLTEACQWRSLDELAAFRGLARGRRKFQGFGDSFAQPTSAASIDDRDPEPERLPAHRISGGSGRAAKRTPTCIRCGEALRLFCQFDPEHMEQFTAPDGLIEWRHRGRAGPDVAERVSEEP